MNDRGYVALYLSELSKIRDKLNDADKAAILNALADLLEFGECNPTLSPVGELLWEYIYQRIVDNWQHYDEVCNKHKECGRLGGRPKKQKVIEENQKNQKVLEETNNNQENLSIKNKEESIKDKEEIIKDKIIEVDKSTLLSADNETERIDYNGLMNFWNLSLGKYNSTLPQIEKMTDARKKSVKRLISEYGKETFWKVLSSAMQSEFLNSGQFKCGFDWVTKPSNFIKILEGNYETKQQQGEERLVKIMNGLFK